MDNHSKYQVLKEQLDGDLFTDNTQRVLYSTDASSYRELPEAVVKPKNVNDIKKVIAFAHKNSTSIIPRGAGTSLAGQVVGNGIVVDVSKYMNKIIELNEKEKWVIVEPGLVLAELNQYLKKYNLVFGPETSTANRCVIGGMLGNNSCGLHSLIHGSVREHILEVDALLSDGSEVTFKALDKKEFEEKYNATDNNLETHIYKNIQSILSDKTNQATIKEEFPTPDVKRRNNGYAIDILLDSAPFSENGEAFNFCKLLAGSEGTLAFSHKAKLNLIDLPPANKGLLCAHFNTLEESLQANIIALEHHPDAIELMDEIVMNCTKENIEQSKNRFFIEGDPAAMLLIEFSHENESEIKKKADALIADLKEAGLGYYFTLVTPPEMINRVWALRKAGLGLLSNIPGDKRNVTVIEDTAVAPKVLPDYIAEFKKILEKYKLTCVYQGHIATGELHLRPLLNLKDPNDVKIYESIALDIAHLVKKYKGSLSGEHGDGRLRGRFIPLMLGENNYQLVRQIKQTWDPDNIFNPGKIVDTPPITENLRIQPGKSNPEPQTFFDFSNTKGFIRAIEKCNGSGDCRKSELIGGTMCPTFMASGDEDKSTRGRANMLRELMHKGNQESPFASKEVYEVLELCISCKACKAECPSNVDLAKLKAEFLQHYYDIHGIPLRSRLVAYLPRLNRLAIAFRPLSNFIMNLPMVKKAIGFTPQRQVPLLSKLTLNRWVGNSQKLTPEKPKGKVFLFNDEFTNYNESDIGIKAILLLTKLDYEVKIPVHKESGRTFLSKGLVRASKKIATENVLLLKDIINPEAPLIGIEPSAILSFRDEYPELVDKTLQTDALELGKNSLLFEEFISREVVKGNISENNFTEEEKQILLHGHCHQKSIASTIPSIKMLSLPKNYLVQEIPSGCCGMAGSFGYEKEHYELSMKIGEMVLFPEVRKVESNTIIAAPGTSCRHHIFDGTGKKAKHPVEIMYEALNPTGHP